MNNSQLDDMLCQMEVLRKKLEQQQIVNDHLMHRSMKRNVSFLKRQCYTSVLICVLMVPCSYLSFVEIAGLSLVFWIATSVFMLACAATAFYNGRDVCDDNLMEYELVEVSHKMAQAKKFHSQCLLRTLPVLFLWIAWYGYEIYQKSGGNDSDMFAFAFGGTLGGIIGGIFGFRLHMKIQRQYQEIIDQIEDLTKE